MNTPLAPEGIGTRMCQSFGFRCLRSSPADDFLERFGASLEEDLMASDGKGSTLPWLAAIASWTSWGAFLTY